ncbi:MAG: hypothetical protein HKN47_10140 [Pirellulaceae bacterium]|nr:hypothetical protein [Pirellulaceae bacterium]
MTVRILVSIANKEHNFATQSRRINLSAAMATDGQVRGTTLQLPTLSRHTTPETAQDSSIASMLRLMCHLCELPERGTVSELQTAN